MMVVLIAIRGTGFIPNQLDWYLATQPYGAWGYTSHHCPDTRDQVYAPCLGARIVPASKAGVCLQATPAN